MTTTLSAAPKFKQLQYQFTAHIRDPDGTARPESIEGRRMAIYRQLFYNNVEGFIANSFPILRQIIADESWHAMVRDFFKRHQSLTPYFNEIPQEFLAYLEQERQSARDPAFMLELAHYEWVEMALDIALDEIDYQGVNTSGDLLRGIPALSPLALALAYQFPVHRIGPSYQPEQPPAEPSYLVVYRNANYQVRFLEINPVTYRFFTLLDENQQLTGEQVLRQIAAELGSENTDMLVQAGAQTLQRLRELDILLGTKLY